MFGPGWRGPNAIRSIETAGPHHAARRRGAGVAARGVHAAADDAGVPFPRSTINAGSKGWGFYTAKAHKRHGVGAFALLAPRAGARSRSVLPAWRSLASG